MPKLSFDDIKRLVRQSITDKLGLLPESEYRVWIRDMWDDETVYEFKNQLYSVSYSIDKDNKITLGDAKKVEIQTSYVTMESLQARYADLIQEVGKRNLDAARPELKALENCKNLLASAGADEVAITDALKECETCLAWVKGQPDMSDPVTQIMEMARANPQKAAAYLSPGGYKGQKLNIPAESLPEVRMAIREAYRKLNLADMPKWVKEPVEHRDYINESVSVPVDEAKKESLAKGVVSIRIIQPGFNASKTRYYTESAIRDAVKIFEGAKMYANHATKSEEKERPERDIRDWVATVKNAKVAENGNAVAEAHIHAGWLKEMVQNLSEQGNLDKLGVSINAIGKGSKQKISGTDTFVVESLIDYPFKSVDFVTEAGAGGQVGVKESAEYVDVYLVDLATLKEARPDLIKEMESEYDSKNKTEVKSKMDLEQENKTLKESIETLTKERDGLKGQIEASQKAQRIAEAKVKIDEAISKSGLPEAAQKRLVERFKDAESDQGVQEAIKAELDYVAALKESGKVKNLGGSNPEATKVDLKESFKRLTGDDRRAEIAAQGR